MGAKSSTPIGDGDLSGGFVTERECVVLVRRKKEFFEVREGGRSSDNFEGPMVDLTKHIQKVQHLIDLRSVDQPEEGVFPSREGV